MSQYIINITWVNRELFTQSYYLGCFTGVQPLGGIVPLLNINLPVLHHVLYILGKTLWLSKLQSSLTVMGYWAVAMPNNAGEKKKTAYSQTLLPSVNIGIHPSTAEVILAAEGGYSITYSAGKWFQCYIHARLIADVWTTDKKAEYLQCLSYPFTFYMGYLLLYVQFTG